MSYGVAFDDPFTGERYRLDSPEAIGPMVQLARGELPSLVEELGTSVDSAAKVARAILAANGIILVDVKGNTNGDLSS